MSTTTASGERVALPQGDVTLLENEVAQRLLTSTVPAGTLGLHRKGWQATGGADLVPLDR